MSYGHSDTTTSSPGHAERRAHRQARFLVPGFDGLIRVQCAVCGATDAGWWQDGTPKYTGGVIDYRDRWGHEHVAACRCHVGADRRDRQGLRYFDRVQAEEWLTFPHAVVEDRGRGHGPSEATKRYADRMAALTTRFQSGDLTIEEYQERARELLESVAPTQAPTLDDILASESLRALYFPTTPVRGQEAA